MCIGTCRGPPPHDHWMMDPTTPAERAKFYLEQAAIAEANASRCADPVTAEAFRKVAREWRTMAAAQERKGQG